MEYIEIILIGTALSMDAAAVSMTNGMVFKKEPLSRKMSFPFFFALFQAIMPLLGFIAGDALADIIIDYSSYAVLIILGIIGIKMLYDGIKNIIQPQECIISQKFTYKTILLQALATSIDAFAVGIGFSVVQVNIFSASAIIGSITFILTLTALFIGGKFGDLLGNKAQILGGLILVAVAVKAVF